MHEMSIAQNILDIVREHVTPEQEQNVRTIKIKLGEFSGVVKESLEFCFSSLVNDTPLREATLEIEDIPIKALCLVCNKESRLEYGVFFCPLCGSNAVKLISGKELQIETIEISDR